MKVFIVGVTGETGSRAACLFQARGDHVSGLYRNTKQGTALAASGIVGTQGDITSIKEEELTAAIAGSDVLLFAAGAGGGDDEKQTDRVDGDGVSKLIVAAKRSGIRRFLLVSVFPEAWRERHMNQSFEHYMSVKKRADMVLSRTDLDWIILRPAALLNEAGVGTVSLDMAGLHTEVSRDDVAATLVELAHAPTLRRRILELSKGQIPIAKAVAAQIELSN